MRVLSCAVSRRRAPRGDAANPKQELRNEATDATQHDENKRSTLLLTNPFRSHRPASPSGALLLIPDEFGVGGEEWCKQRAFRRKDAVTGLQPRHVAIDASRDRRPSS